MFRSQTVFQGLLICLMSAVPASAAAPEYYDALLHYIYPAGAQRGTTVTVELGGYQDGLSGAKELVVDGPPGVKAVSVESKGKGRVQATLEIAADAPAGRRAIRVKGGQAGLTNFRWFFVGTLQEHVEEEKNNSVEAAKEVPVPTVINGRVNPTLDEDCFRFRAQAGQHFVAAVEAHALDAMGTDRNTRGFVDTSLELLDESGRVLDEAGDSLGFDPLIEHTFQAAGWYAVRVRGMGYKGFPEAVYRLTLGEVPFPTAMFPPGGSRGESVEAKFSGPNCPNGQSQTIAVSDNPSLPLQYVSLTNTAMGGRQLPFIRGDLPETIEVEPNQNADQANELSLPMTANGRFEAPGDEDWYRVTLKAGQQVYVETLAQRHLRSPVDTLLQVYDAEGELVQANDDGKIFEGECTHDFIAFDSVLNFKAGTVGEYFIRVSEQTGAGSSRAVYRLTVKEAQPDFRLYQWPDVVPIWGPGSTAALAVEVIRLNGLRSDIDLEIEGLPEGWTGSVGWSDAASYRGPRGCLGTKATLTITAPKDAEVGQMTAFRVVGRAQQGDRQIVHQAQPLTLYVYGEPHRFRASPISRAIVTEPSGPALDTEMKHIEAKAGETAQIPVRVRPSSDDTPVKTMRVSVDECKSHFKSTLVPPKELKVEDGRIMVPVTVPKNRKPGGYGIVVSTAWAGDVRKGLPGPCTPLIRLQVLKAEK